MRFVTTLTVVLVLASLAIVPATAATVSLETSADAWGLSSYYNEDWNADTNYGAQTDAYGHVLMTDWRNNDGIEDHKFWTKFDLSSISGPATSATLEITRTKNPTNAYDAILVYALNDGDAGEGWGEYTITYNNAPGNVLAANEFDVARYTYLGHFDFPAADGPGTVYSFSNEALQQAVNDDTDGNLTLGFLKRMYDNSGSAFASRENAFYEGATLVIEGVTVIGDAVPGDANGDGNVDVSDLGILATNYGTIGGAVWADADFTADGNVDVSDLGILATNYGTTSASAVPEPSTLCLLIFGVLALAWRRSENL